MRYDKLNSKELKIAMDFYIKERDSIIDLISFEEYCDKYLRQCENCGKILSVDEPEDDLMIGTNYRGEKIKSCPECYKYSNEYEEMRHTLMDD